jgi:hypothetical protein
MGAPVVWFDITSNDPARLTAFFGGSVVAPPMDFDGNPVGLWA